MGLLARAFLWTLAMRVLLPVVALRALHRFADRAPRGPVRSHPPETIARAVRAAARRIPGTHCLARSLALHALLRRAGADSVLQIGVRRDGSLLQAHAWVTCAGRPIDDEPQVQAYAAFEPLPR